MVRSSQRIAVMATLGVVAACDAGGSGSSAASGTGGGATCGSSYDQTVLCDHPVAFWAMNKAPGNEPDLAGNSNTGVYKGGAPVLTTLPNGDMAAVFNGSS